MPETLHLPPLIDPHVHLREPGTNRAETIASGTLAAALGGYALVADMPNNPGRPTWSSDRVREKQFIARKDAHTLMAVNAGAQPEADNIGEIAGMMELSVALKGYGGPTTGIERKDDYEAQEFEPIIAELHRVAPDKPFLFHAGQDNLASMIGLVAGKYNHHIHVCHVNDPAQVDIVDTVRKHRDLPVTCGVCPHHILKDSHDRMTEGKFAEMQPPLADQPDAEKLMRYLADGKIQIIESDHAPHSKDAKREAEAAGSSCFGVPGIEHVVSLMLYQVKRGTITHERLIDAMSTQPAELFGLQLSLTGTTWELVDGRIESEEDIISGAGWTPYLGMNTYGKLIESKVAGRMVYVNGHAGPQGYEPIRDRGEVV